jgi:anthranilate synthase component I
MEKLQYQTSVKPVIDGDTLTPIGCYLRIRDSFPNSLLLENSDMQVETNPYTFICIDPLTTYSASKDSYSVAVTGKETIHTAGCDRTSILESFCSFYEGHKADLADSQTGFGIFGYCAFDAIQIFDSIELTQAESPATSIPLIYYQFFRFVLRFNPKRNALDLIENRLLHEPAEFHQQRRERLYSCLRSASPVRFPFEAIGEDEPNFSEDDHKGIIEKAKVHIRRGDVFQIVPSRRFARKYRGDEFEVYRSLRTINPSPYLFYFDYGAFKVFGSSPETHLQTKSGQAVIHPIAGSCPRVADEAENASLMKRLLEDPKENAEHVMLVDLARNDLSKKCLDVRVTRYKELHSYSHIHHMVSEVTGAMMDPADCIGLLVATFPNGTVSGAPKYRAIELIDSLEHGRRGFYSGVLGYFGFNGDSVHAITLRTFWAHQNTLYRQAGGGIVIDSNPEAEVQEVISKLGALTTAIAVAEKTSTEMQVEVSNA